MLLIGALCFVSFLSYYKYSDASGRASEAEVSAGRAQQQADSLAAQLQGPPIPSLSPPSHVSSPSSRLRAQVPAGALAEGGAGGMQAGPPRFRSFRLSSWTPIELRSRWQTWRTPWTS